MPPRLMLLTTDAVGGVWRYSIDLARGLSERGVRVVLAVLGPAASVVQRAEAEGVEGLRLVQTGLPLDWTADDGRALTHASERLSALASLTGVRSVHLHAPALVGEVRWPVPVVAVAHSCVGTWWRAMRAGPPPEDFEWRMAATAAGLRAASAVIAPTGAHAAAVRGVYGPVDIAVVHNGASEFALFPHPDPLPMGEGAEEPSPIGRGSGEGTTSAPSRTILTAGRLWDEAKGAAVIDAAAAHLPIQAAGPTKGPNGSEIHLPNLDLLGTLGPAAMAAAYGRAKVFVSMARYEPFGLSVLEAANAGLRLVLSDIPSFRELWEGAATFADPADLVAVLREALATPGDGGARERAGCYTVARMIEGTLAVHTRLGFPA